MINERRNIVGLPLFYIFGQSPSLTTAAIGREPLEDGTFNYFVALMEPKNQREIGEQIPIEDYDQKADVYMFFPTVDQTLRVFCEIVPHAAERIEEFRTRLEAPKGQWHRV